jgi:hypothetical protein
VKLKAIWRRWQYLFFFGADSIYGTKSLAWFATAAPPDLYIGDLPQPRYVLPLDYVRYAWIHFRMRVLKQGIEDPAAAWRELCQAYPPPTDYSEEAEFATIKRQRDAALWGIKTNN